MVSNRHFIILSLLFSFPTYAGNTENYRAARNAALTAIFIQSGAKAQVKLAEDSLKAKLKNIGGAGALTAGLFVYDAYVKEKMRVKYLNFTFTGNNKGFTLSYSSSF